MNSEKEVTPLDKEALVLLPGLRYARALIDVAMQVARNSALQRNAKTVSKNSVAPRQN